MPDLQTTALRIASDLPVGDPTRRELLAALDADKTAGGGTQSIQIGVDKSSASFWVTFPGYGRVHHITHNLENWQKNMSAALVKARTALNSAGIYIDQGDIFAEPLKGSGRLMVMVGTLRHADHDWSDRMEEVEELLGRRYKRAPLPK